MYKIKRLQIYLIVAISVLLQIGVLNRLNIFGVKPDVILTSVIFLSLFLGPSGGLESGIAAGLLTDIFAFDFFWINTFILGITGLLVGSSSGNFFKESKKAVFTLVLLCTFFTMSIHYLLELFLSQNFYQGYAGYFAKSIIPASIYTAILSIPLYVIFINTYNLKESEDYL